MDEEGGDWKSWPGRAGEFLRNLFDLQFRRLLTPRMLPTLFVLAIVASALWVVAYTAQGFSHSLGEGLLRLLLTGPLAFLTLVTCVRVALELCLAIFRLAVHASRMAGHTEDIAGGLPRITFWKTPRRRNGEDGDDE
ncbi:MAG: DUF4282 domain-containing protein [Nevskia sp.]|nr:DUF4282 domain-containing protein [Nevskia sp.]